MAQDIANITASLNRAHVGEASSNDARVLAMAYASLLQAYGDALAAGDILAEQLRALSAFGTHGERMRAYDAVDSWRRVRRVSS